MRNLGFEQKFIEWQLSAELMPLQELPGRCPCCYPPGHNIEMEFIGWGYYPEKKGWRAYLYYYERDCLIQRFNRCMKSSYFLSNPEEIRQFLKLTSTQRKKLETDFSLFLR